MKHARALTVFQQDEKVLFAPTALEEIMTAPIESISAEPKTAAEPATRILVVEDDPSTRMILERRLKKNGYQVEVAADGQEGLEKTQSWRPQVILSDWMMPRLDGHALCSRLKADPSFQSVYFILLTAKDCKEDMVHGLDAGADDYLVKPCDPQEMMARIRAAERIVHLQQTLEENNRQLERAMRRINDELRVTSQIQRAMLPEELLQVPGYEFAAYYRPSTECSGDYYDVLDLGAGRFGMIIADVSGHGTPAMVAMALARSLVHQLAFEYDQPAEMLMRINKLLYHHLPTSQFMTAFYAVCEVETGRVVYASAGHNPPLVISSGKQAAAYLPHCEGFPLKLVTPDAVYVNHEISLDPADTLLLYTDGIPEAANPQNEQFDVDRLSQSALTSSHLQPQDVLSSIMQTLTDFTEGKPFHDDVTMLLVSRSEASATAPGTAAGRS